MTERVPPQTCCLAACCLLVTLAGCDTLQTALGRSDRVTVRLRNSSEDYDVDVSLYYDSDDNVLEDVLTELGEHRTFLLGPGESSSFSASCDDLQAIVIDDADLQVLLTVETSSGVYRGDGEDFDCGDTIVFTFTHDEFGVNFDVDFSVE